MKFEEAKKKVDNYAYLLSFTFVIAILSLVLTVFDYFGKYFNFYFWFLGLFIISVVLSLILYKKLLKIKKFLKEKV